MQPLDREACNGEKGEAVTEAAIRRSKRWRELGDSESTCDPALPATSPSACLGYLRRGIGTASVGVLDSGVVLLSGLNDAPEASTSPTAMRGMALCERSAALRPPLRPPPSRLPPPPVRL